MGACLGESLAKSSGACTCPASGVWGRVWLSVAATRHKRRGLNSLRAREGSRKWLVQHDPAPRPCRPRPLIHMASLTMPPLSTHSVSPTCPPLSPSLRPPTPPPLSTSSLTPSGPTPSTLADLFYSLAQHEDLANMHYADFTAFLRCARLLKDDILQPQPQSISHLDAPFLLPPSIATFLAQVSGLSPFAADNLWGIVGDLVWDGPSQEEDLRRDREFFKQYGHPLGISASFASHSRVIH